MEKQEAELKALKNETESANMCVRHLRKQVPASSEPALVPTPCTLSPNP